MTPVPKLLVPFTVIPVLSIESNDSGIVRLTIENFVRFCNSNLINQIFQNQVIYFVPFNGIIVFTRLEDEEPCPKIPE